MARRFQLSRIYRKGVIPPFTVTAVLSMGHSNMRDGSKLIAVLCGLPMTISVTAEPLSQVIEQSVRPLPKDLQAKAHVYKYHPKTGERVVLRALQMGLK